MTLYERRALFALPIQDEQHVPGPSALQAGALNLCATRSTGASGEVLPAAVGAEATRAQAVLDGPGHWAAGRCVAQLHLDGQGAGHLRGQLPALGHIRQRVGCAASTII